MQKIIFLFIAFVWINCERLSAQIPVELMVGNNQIQHEFFFFKDLDNRQKWSLFSIGSFVLDYDDSDKNFSQISSQITYNFSKSWGLSGGVFSFNETVAPIVAVSYSYSSKNGDLYLNLFPTLIVEKELSYEFFGLLFYTPKLNEKFSFFSQLVTRTIFDNRLAEHLSSSHQVRVGLCYRDIFQFGIGYNQDFVGSDFSASNNIGVFIRKEL